MLIPGEAAHHHTRVMFESRVVLERGPRRLVPDGARKLFLVVLLEVFRLDARGVVGWRDGRLIGIFRGQRDANRVRQLGFDVRKHTFQVLFRCGIPLAVPIILLLRCRRSAFLVLCLLTVTGGPALLPLVARPAFAMPLMPGTVPVPVVVRTLRSMMVLLVLPAMGSQRSLVCRRRGQRGPVMRRGPAGRGRIMTSVGCWWAVRRWRPRWMLAITRRRPCWRIRSGVRCGSWWWWRWRGRCRRIWAGRERGGRRGQGRTARGIIPRCRRI